MIQDWELSTTLTLRLIGKEAVNLGGGTVVSANGETVISNVHDQVLTHDGQADEAKISTRDNALRNTDIDAGKTRAEVSYQCSLSSKSRKKKD